MLVIYNYKKCFVIVDRCIYSLIVKIKCCKFPVFGKFAHVFCGVMSQEFFLFLTNRA